MFGGGIRKDDGLPAIGSTNIFAALESRRRKSSKKRSEKDRSSSKSEKQQTHLNGDAAQFWSPTPLTLKKSWADVEEEDDDDYYATTAPPPVWGSLKPADDVSLHKEQSSEEEESEGEDEIEDDVDDGAHEEIEEKVSDVISADSGMPIQAAPTPAFTREPDRQLSKKEKKKKELAELDAVLAELGLDKKNTEILTGADPSPEEKVTVKVDDNGDTEPKGDIPVLTESKSFKKKKPKKEKSFKVEKDGDVSVTADAEPIGKDEVGNQEEEPATVSADPKEVLKKLASLKKKKSMKDSDSAAKAAAAEAAVRAAKLAAAKKKEKHHYNQHPSR